VRTVVKHLGHDDGAAQAEQAEPDAADVERPGRRLVENCQVVDGILTRPELLDDADVLAGAVDDKRRHDQLEPGRRAEEERELREVEVVGVGCERLDELAPGQRRRQQLGPERRRQQWRVGEEVLERPAKQRGGSAVSQDDSGLLRRRASRDRPDELIKGVR
jgi:hypothetical protein